HIVIFVLGIYFGQHATYAIVFWSYSSQPLKLMLKNQLLITLRNMMKNKLYLFINIFGMGIAIACCIIGYFNYDFNASFDQNHKNASTIYRVGSVRKFQNELTEFRHAPMGLGNAIKQNVPDVSEVVRFSPNGGNFRVKTELFNSNLDYVDPGF